MPISAFEIIGPPMIGPSSSHTAGACRIGWAARILFDESPRKAEVLLHGSFLATGDGHGTREALVAGVLGMAPDDERLPHALLLAEKQGVEVSFRAIDLGQQAHPNSVQIVLESEKRKLVLIAESVGGGSIALVELDGLRVGIQGNLETLFLWHFDTPGFVARITAVLACVEINVAAIRTSRFERGERSLTTIEIDGHLPEEVTNLLHKAPAVLRHVLLPVLPGS
jgi:L-serine dehydratase